MFIACAGTQANEVPSYGFESAAQKITQLFWPTETANVCGWATRDDADWLKLFSMRFLGPSVRADRVALVSVVTQDGYEKGVRQAAAVHAVRLLRRPGQPQLELQSAAAK